MIAVLNFFSPQIEFGFWSWAIGFCFLLTGFVVGRTSRHAFLKTGTPVIGILLFIDETQQAHECFQEYTKVSAKLYIIAEAILLIPFAYLWFKENSYRKLPIPQITCAIAITVALTLRLLNYPPHLKNIEELSEFIAAASALFYVINIKATFPKTKHFVFLIFLGVVIHFFTPPLRSHICPKVQFWAEKLSYF